MITTLEDVMSKNPITMTPDATVFQAAQRMRDAGIGDVIVMDGDRVTGIVTDRDIVVRGVAEGRDPQQATLRETCSGDLVTLSPVDDVQRAVDLMRQKAIRRIPVVEDGKPVGIVSIGDLAVERDEKSALADISAAKPNT